MTIQSKRIATLLVILLGLGVCFAWHYRPKPPAKVPGMYFYDSGTGDVYTVPPDTLSPHVAPSGSTGFAAAVFSCTSCDDPDQRYVAYLSRQSDQYIDAMTQGEPITPEIAESGTLFALIGSDTFLPASNPQTQRILEQVTRSCPGEKPPIACIP